MASCSPATGSPSRSRNIVPANKIDNYLLPVIILIVLIAAMPLIIDVMRKRRAKRYEPAHRASREAE